MSNQDKFKRAPTHQSHLNPKAPRHRPLVTAIALALSLSMASAQAGVIFVDSASDTDTGVCRLRDAIIAANTDAVVEGCVAGSGPDTIRLFNTVGSTITLSGGRLGPVTTDITIQGDGVSVNGGGSVGIIGASGASARLSIDHLSLINGSAYAGGAVLVDGSAQVMLSNSTLSGNSASTNGGAIHVYEAEVTLLNSTLSGNSAATNGGGIYAYEPVSNDVLSTLSLMNSTLSSNTAGVHGGGISVNAGWAPYSNEGSKVNLISSTLTGNQAGGKGGGLHSVNGADLRLNNSVIANSVNSEGAAADYDCHTDSFGKIYGVNLIETGSYYCPLNGIYGSLIKDVDPALGTLAANGGATQTHAPINSDSPLVNPPLAHPNFPSCQLKQKDVILFQDSVLFITSDQRGFQRTDGSCDIGAVEFNGAPRQTGPDFVVNSDQDPFLVIPESNPVLVEPGGDGYCNESPGDCTLREAVAATNEFSDLSTISFDNTVISAGTIQMQGTQLPTVVSDLTIEGSGMVINGSTFVQTPSSTHVQSRFFEIESSNLVINNLSLIEGEAESGGAILVGGGSTLELNDSTLHLNRALYTGGGVSAEPGAQVTLNNSTISRNRVRDIGGGIYAGADATVTINHSNLYRNSSGDPSPLICNTGAPDFVLCGGGGVFLTSATVTLNNSTLDQNETRDSGGGIRSEGGLLSINNSTLSASQGGAALYSRQTKFTITNSTLSGNTNILFAGGGVTALNGSEGQIVNSTFTDNSAGIGDGLFSRESTITLTNSIMANSYSVDCSSPDGSVTSSGVNLIKDGGADCDLTPGPDLLTVDPMLGPLTDNGGPTLTHLPKTGSPVINAGDNTFVSGGLLYDQRGFGFPRFLDITVDLGSVEWNGFIFASGFED